jgi:acyl transferase domain-containing protein
MIGHIIPASAIAGVIKVALALYHKVLPPTLCDEPNPAFGLDTTPLYVNTETRPWIHGALHPRRAGVNAFGFGGINAHAILEEYCGVEA